MMEQKIIKIDGKILEYKRNTQSIKTYLRKGTIKSPNGARVNCTYDEIWIPQREGKTFVEGTKVSIPLVEGQAVVGEDGRVLKFTTLLRFESK